MIGTTAAILGAAAIGAGASAYSASKASKAASKASDQNAQIQQQQYQQTRADLQPYANAGNTATSALMQRLGLSGPAATTTTATPAATTPATSTGAKTGYSVSPRIPDTGASVAAPASTGTGAQGPAGTDLVQNSDGTTSYIPHTGGVSMTSQQAQALLADRPDVAGSAWLNSVDPSVIGDRTGDGQVTQEDRAAYWQDNYGKQAGYTPPAVSAPEPTASTPSTIPGQTLTSANNGGLGDRPQVSRPGFSEAQPTYTTPSGPDLSGASYQASPFYNLGLSDAMRNVNASYGARGLLKSGAGLKGATDTATNNFLQNYGNWANQQLGIWNTNLNQFNNDRNVGLGQYNANRNVFNQNYNTDTARNDNIFNSDRAYNTDQYNTYTGNLFNLANQGQAAAAGQANAGQNYANQATANNNSLASVQGNAAIAQANGINSAINSGLQAYGAYSNPYNSYKI